MWNTMPLIFTIFIKLIRVLIEQEFLKKKRKKKKEKARRRAVLQISQKQNKTQQQAIKLITSKLHIENIFTLLNIKQ